LTKDLYNAFVNFAQENFNGNLSDAFRYMASVLTQPDRKSQALLMLHATVAPKIFSTLSKFANDSVKRFETITLKKIEEEIMKGMKNV